MKIAGKPNVIERSPKGRVHWLEPSDQHQLSNSCPTFVNCWWMPIGGVRGQKWWKFANILDGWSLTRILVFEKQRLTKFALVWTVLTTQLTLKAKLCISGNRDSENCVMGGLCVDFFQDLPVFSISPQICMLCDALIEILESKLFLDFYIMTVILKFLLPPPCKSETQKWVSVFIKVLIVIELLHMWRYTLQLHIHTLCITKRLWI